MSKVYQDIINTLTYTCVTYRLADLTSQPTTKINLALYKNEMPASNNSRPFLKPKI